MAAFPRLPLNNPAITDRVAPLGGAVAGLAVAALALLVPRGVLEDWVWQSGIASLVSVAAPPLGTTARALLALGGGAIAAAVVWSALFLLFGNGGLLVPKRVREDGVPVVRRADAHPDAPPRRPLSASDLGVPMPPEAAVPEPEVLPALALEPDEQDIPADLDLPLAAFHPAAVPAVPREPVRPVPSLRVPVELAEGERIASVELPRGPSEAGGPPSIESLLRRLEQSTRGRRTAAQ